MSPMTRTGRHAMELGGHESNVPIGALALAATVLTGVVAMIALRVQPSALGLVGPWVSGLPASNMPGGWIAPTLAGGAALTGGASLLLLLAAFVRGVRNDPFRWLGPVLIAFSSVVMARLGLERALGPLPAALFGVLTALLLLGGGVLVQTRSWPSAAAGGVLLSVPILALLADQASRAGSMQKLFYGAQTDGVLSLLVLALTAVGVGLAAYVGRPALKQETQAQRGRAPTPHALAEQHAQLQAAIAHARAAEQRAAEAEEIALLLDRELQMRGVEISPMTGTGQQTMQLELDRDVAALTGKRRGIGFVWLALAVVVATVGGAAAVHFLRYMPLAKQYAEGRAQTLAASGQMTQTSQALTELTQRKDAEIAAANAALELEKKRAAEALAGLEQARAQAAALAAAAETPEATTKAAPAKPEPRAAKRVKKARAKKAPAQPSHMDRETNRALREKVSDDPIAGIE